MKYLRTIPLALAVLSFDVFHHNKQLLGVYWGILLPWSSFTNSLMIADLSQLQNHHPILSILIDILHLSGKTQKDDGHLQTVLSDQICWRFSMCVCVLEFLELCAFTRRTPFIPDWSEDNNEEDEEMKWALNQTHCGFSSFWIRQNKCCQVHKRIPTAITQNEQHHSCGWWSVATTLVVLFFYTSTRFLLRSVHLMTSLSPLSHLFPFSSPFLWCSLLSDPDFTRIC